MRRKKLVLILLGIGLILTLYSDFLLSTRRPERISSRELTINQQRLAPVISALDKYHNDYSVYPDALSALSPTYIYPIPTTTRGFPFVYYQLSSEYRVCVNPDLKAADGGVCCYDVEEDFWDCSPFGFRNFEK